MDLLKYNKVVRSAKKKIIFSSLFFYFFKYLFLEKFSNLLIKIWISTWRILFHPILSLTVFSQYNLKWVIGYAVILGTLAHAALIFWEQFFLNNHFTFLNLNLGMFIFTPFIILLLLFFFAAVVHFFLFLVGGAKEGFKATFRTIIFCEASGILCLIPIVGIYISFVWWFIILVGGLANIHNITKGRAFFSFIMLLFFILFFILGFLPIVISLSFLYYFVKVN